MGMNRLISFSAAVMLALSGCGMIQRQVENRVGEAIGIGGNAGTVAALWPDVPPMEGATKQDLDLPFAMKAVIQGMMRASASQSNVQLDRFDFIAYKTAKTPDDISAFYTKQRMTAAGWNSGDTPGCIAGGATAGAAAGGGFCFFGKQPTAGSGDALIIAMARDEKATATDIWYVRFSGIKK
jgi:hypothetical protein